MKRLYELLNLEFLSPAWNYNVSLVGQCWLLLAHERVKFWVFKSHEKSYYLTIKDGKSLQLVESTELQTKIDNSLLGNFEICDIRVNRSGENSAWNKCKYDFFQTYERDIEEDEYETCDNIAIINPKNVSFITKLTGVTVYNKNDLFQVDKEKFKNIIF